MVAGGNKAGLADRADVSGSAGSKTLTSTSCAAQGDWEAWPCSLLEKDRNRVMKLS